MWRILEFVSNIGIGESTDHVLAVKQSAEDLSFIAGEGIESFCRSFWSQLLTGGDAIQGTDRIRWIVDFSKSRQITAVGSQRDITITEQVGHAFSHVDPCHDLLALARHLLADCKSLRFVNDHF